MTFYFMSFLDAARLATVSLALALAGCNSSVIFSVLDDNRKKGYCFNEWSGKSQRADIDYFCATAFNKLDEGRKVEYCVNHLRASIGADVKPGGWLNNACLSSKMHPRDKLVVAKLSEQLNIPNPASGRPVSAPPAEQPDQCALAKASAEQAVKDFDEWGNENALAFAAGVPRSELPPSPRAIEALEKVREACP